MRDFLWSRSQWKSDLLINWIKDFSPDVLFFQGSNSVFGYEIALWICKEFNIPLILQLTDDYTANLYNWSLLEKINKAKYKKLFSEAISMASKVITISEYMSNEYKSNFGGDYIVLSNSVYIKSTGEEPHYKGELRFLYAGNVSINRWKVLKKIGKEISVINAKYHMKSKLYIYTPTLMQKQVRESLASVDSIECKGTLNQEELEIEIQRSNVLIHVEAFDKKTKLITRLSISTKIPEYMASKRCIFAVGPSDVASIMYLRDNYCAKVVEADNIRLIEESLLELIKEPQVRKAYSETAYNAYCLWHHPDISQRIIRKIIEDSC